MAHKCDGCRYKGEHQEMGFVPFGVCLKETNLIKAEQNYNAACCPYIVDVYAEYAAEEIQNSIDNMTDEQKKALELLTKEQDDIERAVEALQRFAQALSEVLTPIIEKTWETIKTVGDAILHYHPDKKVLHLAMHHPKERVRKKNIRRIMRWLEKGGK